MGHTRHIQPIRVALCLLLTVLCCDSATTVLVMRHCARSTEDDSIKTGPQLRYSSVSSYSAKSWPAFPVAEMYCLPRGADIVEAEGKWMRANGALPEPVHTIVDEMQRDVETGLRFMKGLEVDINKSNFVLDKRPFCEVMLDDPTCSASFEQSPGENAALLSALEENQISENERYMLMNRLLEIMGKGVGGDWTDVPCTINNATFPFELDGSCQAAAQFAERLIMEWAGGMVPGWGRVTEPGYEIPRLSRLLSNYFYTLRGNPFDAARRGAGMPWAILEALQDRTNGTQIFVGHDTDLVTLSRIFGLRWEADPWGVNASLPGSFLRFDFDPNTSSVTATYNYVASFATAAGSISIVPADFGNGVGNVAPVADMIQSAHKNTIPECRRVPAHIDLSDPHTLLVIVVVVLGIVILVSAAVFLVRRKRRGAGPGRPFPEAAVALTTP